MAAVKQLVEALLPGIRDMELSIADLVAEGEKVWAGCTFRERHTSDLLGIPATGRRIDIGLSEQLSAAPPRTRRISQAAVGV